jgi:hypothetical protein
MLVGYPSVLVIVGITTFVGGVLIFGALRRHPVATEPAER